MLGPGIQRVDVMRYSLEYPGQYLRMELSSTFQFNLIQSE